MDDDGDFTFALVQPLPGGSIFPGGRRIGTPLYPVFGRPRSPPRRPAPEPESTATTTRLPKDGKPAETCYCSWCPGSPAAASPSRLRCRKSGSTGSVFRWRQLRLVGRSHSDGKEKFVFLDASPSDQRKGRSGGAEGGGIAGHAWSYYAKGGGGGAGGNGGRRRSFLPYRQDLVGLFARATVFRRSYHPF